jgi:hypothetical protein
LKPNPSPEVNMNNEMDIKIENRMTAGERDINVFHYSTSSSHLISHNSSVTLPLRNSGENDYLHISVVRGPGYLWKDSVISVPAWLNFDISSEGKLALSHTGEPGHMQLRIPPGPPTWELTVTLPALSLQEEPSTSIRREYITILDDEPLKE